MVEIMKLIGILDTYEDEREEEVEERDQGLFDLLPDPAKATTASVANADKRTESPSQQRPH
jgi:hypothetical protein